MYIAYFPDQTAQKSQPIWQSFLDSCKKFNITPVENSMDSDAALIWSVLWQGRMEKNYLVYKHYRKQGKPIFILEVGALDRGRTWKVAVNNITKNGIYANTENLDLDRSKKIGIELITRKIDLQAPILIATQHENSLQWSVPLTVRNWVLTQIEKIREHTDRDIIIRTHPRFYIGNFTGKNIFMSIPKKIEGTYDKYDLNFEYSTIINYNSGVGVQAAINGTPVITDQSSLAHDMATTVDQINDVRLPDRSEWFEKILHTEWTVEEIADGVPLARLLSNTNLTTAIC
jgi:hypothetical protein